jgi:ketosteroid isomerase-like protein
MSQENVERLCQSFAAWRRRDVDAVLADSHSDVEIAPVMGPASTTYRGHEGMRRFWDDIFSTFPDFSPELVEARDLGDFVLGAVRIRGEGTGSHVLTEQTVWYATEWRDDKLLWYRAYETEAEALEAVGLSE